MAPTTSTIDELTLSVTQEVQVNAPLEATFAALLEEMGPHNVAKNGAPMPMKIEARPGGRWLRDLGQDNGHLWGHVQAIKRPTLLEITGPLFMSYAVVSNIQYRLTPVDGATLITFKHSAMGLIPHDHRTGLASGWTLLLERVRRSAETAART
ncbi:MAG: SRPBCC domain-containing protein [Luteitalea sp.]|nr:SRPBCC domain-containing protein [Luteitalea sp.]